DDPTNLPARADPRAGTDHLDPPLPRMRWAALGRLQEPPHRRHLDGVVRLAVQVRRCRAPDCPRSGVPVRPEHEGRIALPESEFGLDVIALIGRLRHAEHRSVPEIHAELVRRGVPVCVRSVGNLLDRYDELLALSLADPRRFREAAAAAGRVALAIDGLQPDVGHEALWVLRDCLSGEVLLARGLLSSGQDALAGLTGRV